jgi:SPP1 family predicted phage head-tail adaptor
MTLAAGSLNRQIVIQKRAAGVDALNMPNGTFADYVTVWAWVRGETGMGTIRSGQEGVAASINKYSYRIRFRTDISADMRIKDGSDYLDIVPGGVVMDKAGREWTDLVCILGGSNG